MWLWCGENIEFGGYLSMCARGEQVFWYSLHVNIDRPVSQLKKSLCSVFFGDPYSPLQPKHPHETWPELAFTVSSFSLEIEEEEVEVNTSSLAVCRKVQRVNIVNPGM